MGIIGIGLFSFLLTAFHPSLGMGQSPPSVPPPHVLDPTGRSGEPPPLQKEEPLPPTPPPQLILPPVETLPELQEKRAPQLRIMVHKIHVKGSTVFTEEELAKVTAPYENRELSTEDLEELRRALTLLYVNKGYVNSGAIIPDQAVKEGEITIQIIEGELTDITIEGNKYFLPFYLKDRIALDAGPPFNIRPLKERLQILLQDPRIERLNTELKPGLKPGEAVLHARVQEASPFRTWVEFNNYQSPTIGAERLLGTVAVDNGFGIGDQFLFTFGESKGLNPLLDTSYIIPFTARDTTLELHYRQNDYSVVSKPFNDLNITSNTKIFTIAIRQPLYRTITDEVAISLIGEHLKNQSFLDGTGFSFTPGTTSNGKSIVSAIRFAQEWIHREPKQVLSLRSRFSVGLDVLGATNNQQSGNDADSHYFVWLGQAQWVRRIDPMGIEFLSSLALQISNDSLFPLEQFAVGGRYSVRGYRENTLVRDNAFLFSVESRIPVLPAVMGPNFSAHFAPFIDVGRSWNAQFPTPSPETLASIGAGVRLAFFNRAFANVYWGQQLNHVTDPPPGGNMQDHGLHVQFVMNIL